MDRLSAQAVNILVGNEVNDAVIEFHFPASEILFAQPAMIAIGGADFSASLNGEIIPLLQPVITGKNSVLQFRQWKKSARAYLAIGEKIKIKKWLNSYSTNMKAGIGGYHGRALRKDDVIAFENEIDHSSFLGGKDFMALPWKADIELKPSDTFGVIAGSEWDWLEERSQQVFLN